MPLDMNKRWISGVIAFLMCAHHICVVPEASTAEIGINDTAKVIPVAGREQANAANFFEDGQAIEVEGELGLTPAEVKGQQEVFRSVGEIQTSDEFDGDRKTGTDVISLPAGLSRHEANLAEQSILAQKDEESKGIVAQGAPRCETIWPKNLQVCGEILSQYKRLGGVTSWLLYPVEPQYLNPDGTGMRQKFANGWIYWSPTTGAHAVARHTAAVWAENGWEAGWMGYPITGEVPVHGSTGLDGELQGWVQEFQGGRIYRSQALNGFHVASINGLILEKWLAMGGPDSPLGFPTANEAKTPDVQGRFSVFQRGSIYWHPMHGAHPVEGEILKKWAKEGYETGQWGYPIEDPVVQEGTSYAKQRFERGMIEGALFVTIQPIVTPYIHFQTQAEADQFFGKLEDLLESGMALDRALNTAAPGMPKEYGPCTLVPENIHLRSSSDFTTIGFKARTNCTVNVHSIKHELDLYRYKWFPLPMGKFEHLKSVESSNTGQNTLYSRTLEVSCKGDKPHQFGGTAGGKIMFGGKEYHARVYPPFARLDCGVE